MAPSSKPVGTLYRPTERMVLFKEQTLTVFRNEIIKNNYGKRKRDKIEQTGKDRQKKEILQYNTNNL